MVPGSKQLRPSLSGTTLIEEWPTMNEQQQEVASNWLTGSGWVIVVFIGAFILIAAIAWARAQNAKRSPRDEARTEEATRRLYEDQNREDDLRNR